MKIKLMNLKPKWIAVIVLMVVTGHVTAAAPSLTIYNQNFAVVRDTVSLDLKAGINEVSQAVSQMDEMTQQNAALVEEASASSKAMEEQSQGLLDQVSFFKTGEDKGPGATAIRTAPRMAAVPRGRVASAKTDDDWQEF